MCAVCRTAPAAVLDHCHEHGYVRGPVCQSCNTQERPDNLYSNDIRVANHYTRLFDTHAADWLQHWHRCPGCRTRTTLPLPHLAAWTAYIACRSLRPTHRNPRGSRARKPCGVLLCPGRAARTRPVPVSSRSPSTSAPPGNTASWRESPTVKPPSNLASGWPRSPLPWLPRLDPIAWMASPPGPGQSPQIPTVRARRCSEQAASAFKRLAAGLGPAGSRPRIHRRVTRSGSPFSLVAGSWRLSLRRAGVSADVPSGQGTLCGL